MAAHEPLEVVQLGLFLSVVVLTPQGEDIELECKRKDARPLYWCESGKFLFFSAYRPSKRRSNSASQSQIRVYQTWHDQDPKNARVETYPHSLAGAWKKIGIVKRIDYHSTKWGEDVEYKHESRGGSYLYQLGTGASSVYAIQGKMRATERGLIK